MIDNLLHISALGSSNDSIDVSFFLFNHVFNALVYCCIFDPCRIYLVVPYLLLFRFTFLNIGKKSFRIADFNTFFILSGLNVPYFGLFIRHSRNSLDYNWMGLFCKYFYCLIKRIKRWLISFITFGFISLFINKYLIFDESLLIYLFVVLDFFLYFVKKI